MAIQARGLIRERVVCNQLNPVVKNTQSQARMKRMDLLLISRQLLQLTTAAQKTLLIQFPQNHPSAYQLT
jgi:hypothetical protein